MAIRSAASSALARLRDANWGSAAQAGREAHAIVHAKAVMRSSEINVCTLLSFFAHRTITDPGLACGVSTSELGEAVAWWGRLDRVEDRELAHRMPRRGARDKSLQQRANR